MTYKFEDFVSDEASSSESVRIACPLGNECDHASVDECDAYRQKLLEEAHKKECPIVLAGRECPHFNKVKGFPLHARFQNMSPAEFLIWSRTGK